MSKEKECKCCKRIWYEDMLDKKLELCPTCYEYCKPLIDGLKIKYKNIADLEAKLAESEKSKESYRLQNEHHHLQLLQFYSRLGVEAFGADIHEKALETLMIMKEHLAESEEKCKKAYQEGLLQKQFDKDMEIEQLKQQLAEKEKELKQIKQNDKTNLVRSKAVGESEGVCK